MKVTLTIDFDSLGELQNYLGTPAAPEPATAAPLAAVPDPEPEPEPVEEFEPVEQEDIDVSKTRAELMARMQTMANEMDDPSVLGAFINGFGVDRFSNLPDDQILTFKTAFENEFGL